jgi:hypothetical protein
MVTNVQVVNQGCSVKITWARPENGMAFPITKYEVTVRGADDKFHEIRRCWQWESLKCVVPMPYFTYKPFSLLKGQKVFAKV